ncbi:MAG TPA: putative sulfate exporter family transporter [Rectinemataceae bacterium]|nr:putative sulfate exporter family transporter [Rectinemataceae bacterium]
MPAISIPKTQDSKPAADKALALLPGLLVVAIVTIAGMLLQGTELFSRIIPMSSLILAILIGMVAGNLLPLPASTRPGIKYASKTILRLAVIFLGFKLSVGQIIGIGPEAMASALFGSTMVILFTLWLGKRMGLPTKRALLMGSGIAVCGAAAVAAVDGVIDGEEEDTAFAISAVTFFGTIYIFLYPAIRALTGMPNLFFALWTGSSIHEVAQVAAASAVLPDAFRGIAATVKMIRVLFIIPFTLILSFIPWGGEAAPEAGAASAPQARRRGRRVSVPWFALLFFVAALINSFVPMSGTAHAGLAGFDTWIMTAAMAGLGLDIRFKALAKIGLRAAVLGAVSSVFLSALSAASIAILRIHL